MKALDVKISRLKNGAYQEVDVLKEVLTARLKLVNQQIEKMEDIVREKGDGDLTIQQEKYNTAKEEYEQARDLYREMKLQQQEQRVFLNMPRTPVTLHERTK